MRMPVVAIVGRPNVGKSTLFNRLAGRRLSIVEDLPGVTRDRLYAEATLTDDADGELVRFVLIDTGGFEPDPETLLFEGIRDQAQLAIEEADLVLMIVDARDGPVPADQEVVHLLRKSGCPLVLAANKMDSPKQDHFAHEFYELGVESVFPMSAEHGRGVAEMLDGLFEGLSPELMQAGKDAQFAWEEEQRRKHSPEAFDEILNRAEEELEDAGMLEADYDEDEEGHYHGGGELGEQVEFIEVTGDEGELGDDDVLAYEEDTLHYASDECEKYASGDAEDGGDEEEEEEPEVLTEKDVVRGEQQRITTTKGREIEVHLPEVLRLAIIGKPNAGKSSFINKLLGENRHLVSELPGTTMDAVDSFLEFGGNRYRLIDTAGIRRKRSISQRVEKFAVVAALRGLDRCDIALFVVDATKGLTEQDLKVAAFAHDKGKAIIILVNKWDLAKENDLDAKIFAERIRDKAAFLAYAPIRFISAKTGRRVYDVLDVVEEVAIQYFTRVPTGQLNRVVEAAVRAHPPPVRKTRRVKVYFGSQVTTSPPTFVFATNHKDGIHFSYERYLTNQLRQAFGFNGTPVKLFFRERSTTAGKLKNLEARKRRESKERKKGPSRRQKGKLGQKKN
ncbi:MAG: ribosome biogenesis GTPase Der [Deltaproteobacteria bacterium]|nr:ribosome biogenesis GTPase Der [Deltaproteobacteria bacterium]